MRGRKGSWQPLKRQAERREGGRGRRKMGMRMEGGKEGGRKRRREWGRKRS
jgi:hypothetical protein